MTEQQAPAPDLSLTHRVRRISNGAPNPFRIFFNTIGRSLEFAPADVVEDGVIPGSPQDVCAGVAAAITDDPGLAPHFKVQAIADADAEDAAAAAPAETVSRARTRRSEAPTE